MTSRHVFSTLISIPVLFMLKCLAGLTPYTRQGFFCDDDEIRHPYREDSIKSRAMQLMFLLIGSILFTITEYWLIRHLTRKGRRLIVNKNIHPFIYSFIFLLSSYICSSLATTITTTFAKRTVSRLRPNFLAVCQPNLTALCPLGSHVFVEDYVCYGKFHEDEYYSFPSGHSSSAANFAVFFIIYLQKRCKFHEVIRAFIQFAIFLLAVYVFCSRIRDYKHRLADVLGGATLGALFALFFVMFVINNFKSNRYEIRDGDYDDDQPQQESPVQIHVDRPIYPPAVVSKVSKSSSEYGSLDDSDRAKSYEQI